MVFARARLLSNQVVGRLDLLLPYPVQHLFPHDHDRLAEMGGDCQSDHQHVLAQDPINWGVHLADERFMGEEVMKEV